MNHWAKVVSIGKGIDLPKDMHNVFSVMNHSSTKQAKLFKKTKLLQRRSPMPPPTKLFKDRKKEASRTRCRQQIRTSNPGPDFFYDTLVVELFNATKGQVAIRLEDFGRCKQITA